MKVVDCRICGDPSSVLRFAFVEFTDEGNVKFCGASLKSFQRGNEIVMVTRSIILLVMQKVQGLLYIWRGRCLDSTL